MVAAAANNPFISLDLGGVEDFYDAGINEVCKCQYLGPFVIASIIQIFSPTLLHLWYFPWVLH